MKHFNLSYKLCKNDTEMPRTKTKWRMNEVKEGIKKNPFMMFQELGSF